MNIPEYKQDKIDNFYKWKGVKPPERTSHGISEDDIDNLLAEHIKNHQCHYTQRGNYISCETGNFEHGKNIGIHKRLVETKDNQPVLVDITFS